ncbi:hypothetical protein GCM10025858_34030 [Alicyclobacillus sacchari]|uniref:hypothetical protein n=1 Tax=Alicyclobacillus sacchari TaxID=392010 RepID=UPI0023E99138|nr:hypothetical protein [Alicyclobacillus sacchari]GMA58900.1 hypothetical protein GCM10025858_34030 [Alicyclobacillus sacchari]
MKTIEGILRYDPLDTESWCFDMGYQSIPTNTGMAVQILVDGRFLSGRLLETVDGGMIVRLVGSRKDRQWSYVLEPHALSRQDGRGDGGTDFGRVSLTRPALKILWR